MPPVVWTLGHSNREQGQFLRLLESTGIRRLIDVRRYPHSRRHPWFDTRALAAACPEIGVEYRHAEILGGHRDALPDSPNTALDEAFRGYADHARTPPFRRALQHLLNLAEDTPTAIMCAEASPENCHRRVLCDHLVAAGADVRHVLAPDRIETHKTNPHARADADGLLTYPHPDDAQGKLF